MAPGTAWRVLLFQGPTKCYVLPVGQLVQRIAGALVLFPPPGLILVVGMFAFVDDT